MFQEAFETFGKDFIDKEELKISKFIYINYLVFTMLEVYIESEFEDTFEKLDSDMVSYKISYFQDGLVSFEDLRAYIMLNE